MWIIDCRFWFIVVIHQQLRGVRSLDSINLLLCTFWSIVIVFQLQKLLILLKKSPKTGVEWKECTLLHLDIKLDSVAQIDPFGCYKTDSFAIILTPGWHLSNNSCSVKVEEIWSWINWLSSGRVEESVVLNVAVTHFYPSNLLLTLTAINLSLYADDSPLFLSLDAVSYLWLILSKSQDPFHSQVKSLVKVCHHVSNQVRLRVFNIKVEYQVLYFLGYDNTVLFGHGSKTKTSRTYVT